MLRLIIAGAALVTLAGTAGAQTSPATPEAPPTAPAPTDTQPGMASPQGSTAPEATAPMPADTNATTDEPNAKGKKKHKPH